MLEQNLGEVGAAVEQMLAVVEHHERVAVREVVVESRMNGVATAVGEVESERRRDFGVDLSRIGHDSEIDEHRTVAERAERGPGDFDRETGLPTSSDSRERHDSLR